MRLYKPYFKKVISTYYPDCSKLLIEIDSTYQSILPDVQFARTSSNPMDKRMEFAGYFLATIQVLDRNGESYEKIRTVLIDIAREYVQPKNGIQRFFKKLPARIAGTALAKMTLRQLDKKANRRAHPNGFVAKIITDKNETYGFGYGIDILECGICKLFQKHQYKKFSPLLCEIDYITSNLAGLKLIRSGTIANGAEKCDFRFMKVR